MLPKCKRHTPNLLLLQAAVSNIISKCNRSTNLPKLSSSQNATDTKSSFVTKREREMLVSSESVYQIILSKKAGPVMVQVGGSVD
jgi:hypothetical protein